MQKKRRIALISLIKHNSLLYWALQEKNKKPTKRRKTKVTTTDDIRKDCENGKKQVMEILPESKLA